MNCFEFRRLIFAEPQRLPKAMLRHKEQCAACARLARQMESFEAAIREAAMVPVPEALADRVLLRYGSARPLLPWLRFGAWAVAAVLVLGVAVAVHLRDRNTDDVAAVVQTAESVGSDHPAVAAINYVLDNEPKLLKENRTGDRAVLAAALDKMRIRLPDDGTVRYLGKCPVPGGEGEHVVLQTAGARFSLILVPDRRFPGRVVVTDRNMVALSAPARSGTGSVIIVANSLQMLAGIESRL